MIDSQKLRQLESDLDSALESIADEAAFAAYTALREFTYITITEDNRADFIEKMAEFIRGEMTVKI